MGTGHGIQAGIGDQQALYWFSADDVGSDDFLNVVLRYVAVPDCFRIDDDRWPMLALIEASGFIGSNSIADAMLG
jgi:hypothetical protein